MQQIFSNIKQAFRKRILILALTTLVVSSLSMFIAQPSYAATPNQKLIQQERMDKESQAANSREQAYEEQLKAAEDPDKVYEKNLKAFKEANPDEGLIQKTVEGTKELVDKVTTKK